MNNLQKAAPSESHQFLNALYGDIEQEAYLILWSKLDKQSRSFPVSDLTQALNLAGTLKSKHDVYYGVGLQKHQQNSWERGKAIDVVGIPGLWFDLDIDGPGHKETRIPPDQDAALKFLDALSWKPTMIVNSGGGIHAYWLFKEPWIFDDDEERIEARELSVRFQAHIKGIAEAKYGWKLDTTSDLSRLLRVPGTLNHKSEPPIPVSTISHNDHLRYNPDDFADEIKDIVVPTDYRSEYSENGNWAPANIDPIVQGCSFMRHCRDDAKNLPEPHWHSMMTILCRCHNSVNLAHEWSLPYPKYNKRETDQKLDHALNNNGPHTCEYIQTTHQFSLCESCPNKDKVKSPIQLGAVKRSSTVYSLSSNSNKAERWEAVRDYFPKTHFPWENLPEDISKSLKQLARSCAISPNPLPGVTFSTLASTIGNRVTVSPKSSWKEPMIIWHGDIRDSGEGKTPASSQLIAPLYGLQSQENKRFRSEMTKFNANAKMPKSKQESLEEPIERGFITSDLTIEGLHRELKDHPTGGIFCDLTELSVLISGQNQYKINGTDRESWLRFWDGSRARLSRKSGSVFFKNPCISLAGGIQPGIFNAVFGAKKGKALEDGTIYRFLFVYEKPRARKQTSESWSEANREAWHGLLQYSVKWADAQHGILNMILSKEAQTAFFDWANELGEFNELLPHEFKGFISKASSYCLRLAGVIHCLWAFQHRCEPAKILQTDDIEKAIKAVEFYLGQSVDAMMTLLGIKSSETNNDPCKEAILAEALKGIKDGVVSNKILMADVLEMYNGLADTDNEFNSSRSFGAFVRGLGLSVPTGTQRAGEKTGVCLDWNSAVDDFISRNSPEDSGDGNV
ncbi:DNA primase small subunit [Desulfatibacillum aliphaticivorans]|uniref:DNA primase small subunit n=1 Tax=Desulfatibacillum aliphaticivorans TaxID=218208 RepID=B8F9R5_DESAL|nr:DUF3987 domain-containing protein [Desulfatibacillum aliphaticivorans]ACL03011.1 DNA primase small subunit [Desulfatibacillum aliphaticivorans]